MLRHQSINTDICSIFYDYFSFIFIIVLNTLPKVMRPLGLELRLLLFRNVAYVILISMLTCQDTWQKKKKNWKLLALLEPKIIITITTFYLVIHEVL